MVSMERTPAEKAEARAEMEMPPAVSALPDVPYGLRITLTESELEKLGIDIDDKNDEPSVGDMIHLFCMAKVTCVSSEDTGQGKRQRVELSIVSMAAEDEDDEDEPDADDKQRK